jgi:hypothetical protein
MSRPMSSIVVVTGQLGCPPQLGMQVGQAVGENGLMTATHHGEAERPVEGRQVALAKASGLALPEPDARHTLSVGDLVVERGRIPAEPDHRWQLLET